MLNKLLAKTISVSEHNLPPNNENFKDCRGGEAKGSEDKKGLEENRDAPKKVEGNGLHSPSRGMRLRQKGRGET